jgi:hypothetical protein
MSVDMWAGLGSKSIETLVPQLEDTRRNIEKLIFLNSKSHKQRTPKGPSSPKGMRRNKRIIK